LKSPTYAVIPVIPSIPKKYCTGAPIVFITNYFGMKNSGDIVDTIRRAY
jgi:hypothetical protein